ncbi:MAG TPA: prolyl oligopeptidase family serine peptidase [Polyangia bacterium]|nr:prolyl oligopeptidase family serine peptidase [Polyangia bacterium]
MKLGFFISMTLALGAALAAASCGSGGSASPAGTGGAAGAPVSTGGSPGQAGSGGRPGTGGGPVQIDAGAPAGQAGREGSAGAGGRVGSSGGAAGATSSSGGGAGGTSSSGGAGGTSSSGGAGGKLAPPVSDSSSTLGVSAPGAGYHVEGNIPYGPFTMQRLDVMYPNGAGPTGNVTLPGVIMFHGGGWTDNRPAALKASMSSFFSRFLKHGFLVCNVEYRLADGTANGATAPAADQDALAAAKWFWSYMDYYHVDRTKYVVTGASAGGQLALMVGMATDVPALGPTNPGDFSIAAIVNGYGPSNVTDLLARNISWAEQWLPASTPNRAALAVEVSPITYVRQDVPPLITVQGMDDTTVPTAESQALYDALVAAGADTALHFVAGAGHGFSTPATAWPDAESAMFTFLVQHGIGK